MEISSDDEDVHFIAEVPCRVAEEVQGEGVDQAALVVHQEPPVVHEEVQPEVEEKQEEDEEEEEERDEDEAQDEEEEDEEGEPQEEQVQGEVFEEEAGDVDEGQEVDPGEFNVDSEDEFGGNIYHYSLGDSDVDSEASSSPRPSSSGSSLFKRNIPLDFAREHFCRLGKTTDVVLWLYDTKFKAKLKIKTYDGKMVQCLIKDGVDAVIDEYDVQVDEGAFGKA
ncbi:glutamic acid-rich protein-like [Chenopodium quinoa]|uniref:glutamic acid-rich protein-like n=1 Tax=Chenopodium quinoa TaxID=63459 RepID=UPI000B798315|nr:glutamic acid-rich protein-like [Chenopodium quinoa]